MDDDRNINDMDTVIEPGGKPVRDPLPLPYCAAHIDLARELSEMHALAQSHERRGNRLEDYLHEQFHGVHAKLIEHGENIVALRKDMAYHSKFFGAIAGAVVSAFWWFIGGRQ